MSIYNDEEEISYKLKYFRLKHSTKEMENKLNKLLEEHKLLLSKYKYISIEYEELLENYKELEKKKNTTSHNARGAGRKQKFGEVDVNSMKMYKMQGMSTREIAEIFNCSHVTVSKLIK